MSEAKWHELSVSCALCHGDTKPTNVAANTDGKLRLIVFCKRCKAFNELEFTFPELVDICRQVDEQESQIHKVLASIEHQMQTFDLDNFPSD